VLRKLFSNYLHNRMQCTEIVVFKSLYKKVSCSVSRCCTWVFTFLPLNQRFPNCGTRRPSRWYANRPTTFCLSSQKIIRSYLFTYRVLLNSCIFVYSPCWFVKMAITFSHSHYLHVAFLSIQVFQTFDGMIFGKLSFPGARWHVVIVWVP